MQTLDLEYIKNRRESLDISLQVMAESLGFKNASTYLKYENGTYTFKADQLPILA
ncbi:helix-turn-helix transcriptional regulator, partial [Robertmurraya sp. DFI.2.37]|uniref:helix-turn-helix domain-containing protein n=1 Tax=Robertmurraya sp. DFI.2.37 TaxID=3031819 RepID=UPI0023D99AD1